MTLTDTQIIKLTEKILFEFEGLVLNKCEFGLTETENKRYKQIKQQILDDNKLMSLMIKHDQFSLTESSLKLLQENKQLKEELETIKNK